MSKKKQTYVIHDSEEPSDVFVEGTLEELKDWWWEQLSIMQKEVGGYELSSKKEHKKILKEFGE